MQERDNSQRVYYASSVIEAGTVKDSATSSTTKENENESQRLLVAAPTSSMSSSRGYSHVDSFVKCKGIRWAGRGYLFRYLRLVT